jgi:hypothetical protein
VDWILGNWQLILGLISGLIGIASFITGLTDTPDDDKVVDWIRRAFGMLSVAEHKDGEGSLKLPGTTPSAPILTERTDGEESGEMRPMDGP